jgi:hypothetical protein
MRGISWVAEDLLASQEGLCSMELVSSLRYISSNFVQKLLRQQLLIRTDLLFKVSNNLFLYNIWFQRNMFRFNKKLKSG